jgi:hypothetical protein
MTITEISPDDTSNTCDCCMCGWNNPNEYGLCICMCGLCSEPYRFCRGQCNEPDIVIDDDSDDDDLDNYCDCCTELWNDCNCWCANCYGDYKTCRSQCNRQ